MRLIDGHVLMESLQKATSNAIKPDFAKGLLEAQRLTINAPTIDAVEVVRCKDCYHAEDDITHMFCVYFHHKVYEDDYCSNAVERREDSEV